MKRQSKIILSILIILIMISLTSCTMSGEVGEYTYRSYTTALGSSWNPHTWENTADREIMELVTTPLVSVLPLDTEVGSYQWCFEHAESVRDVTGEYREDLLHYDVDLGTLSPGEVTDGYVFRITLREGLLFDNGTPINADTFVRSMELLLDEKMKNSRANLYISGEAAIAGADAYFRNGGDFSTVGLYKVDDLTLHYVTASYIEYNYFLSSLGSSWLVDPERYEAGFKTEGELLSTNYNTSPATTSSSGPYKIKSYQTEKEMVFVRNENWYGWQKSDTGALFSLTNEEINGERVEQYMATSVIISVMDEVTAKQSFFRGELSVYTPTADEYSVYRTSDKLYLEDETYTMSLFFNTDPDMLKVMDKSKGNKNSLVLSNDNFRHAMSLAINRPELSYSSGGYTPVYALLNDLYHYDVYNDPSSVYRDSEEAMRAIVRLYDTEYGTGTPYPTLRDAYLSITGYNETLARDYFKAAAGELIEAGIYTEGEPIKIRIAWAKGALTSDDNKLVTALNGYLNRACEGTGLGKITLVPVGQVASRYRAVPEGEFAIGYGAWGGAAFYPFRAFRVYLDPEYQSLHEDACWSPESERLTLTIGGDDVTMTYQEWSRSMTGSGAFSRASVNTKLEITAKLEEAFLAKYYRIPLLASAAPTLLSYNVDNLTREYNVMYGFGGFRLLRFYMDDYEWSKYLSKNGGRLEYE